MHPLSHLKLRKKSSSPIILNLLLQSFDVVAILGCGVRECMIVALLADKLCLDGECKRKVVQIGLGDVGCLEYGWSERIRENDQT